MGQKESKSKNNQSSPVRSDSSLSRKIIPHHIIPDLSDKDYTFFVSQTGLLKSDIKSIFDKFKTENSDCRLKKNEFIHLYQSLRPEPAETLDEISDYVFRCFDSDLNGFISFNEFLIAYALTSRGDLSKKLDYAFNMYDLDRNGYLDNGELNTVLYGMLDMLGAERKHSDIKSLAEQCLKDLDTSHDGKVTKDEFINGLMRNYSLRALMSPFN